MQTLCKLGHSQINWGKNLVALAGTICSLLILSISEPQPPFPIHFETCFPMAVKKDLSRETNHPSIFQVGHSNVHSAVGRGSGEGQERGLGLTAGY